MRHANLIYGVLASAGLHAALLSAPGLAPQPLPRNLPTIEIGLATQLDPKLADSRRSTTAANDTAEATVSPSSANPPEICAATQTAPPTPTATPDEELEKTVAALVDFETTPPSPAQPLSAVQTQTETSSVMRQAPAWPSLASAPACTYNPPPTYPGIALRRGWEGEVHLQARITPEGHVDSVTVEQTSGYPVLDDAAIEAVHTWRFSPPPTTDSSNDLPVSIPVRFQIRRS